MRRFLNDERLLRVFTFQALYAGVPPQSALAVYAVIAYMDTVAGVYFPRGGMRALPDAMAAAAADAGVEFVYGSTVSELEWSGSRVTAVRTAAGHRVPADAVVLTTELPDTYRLLGRTPRRLLPLRPAPSAVVAHVGCRSGRRSGRSPHHPVRRRLAADLPRHHRRRTGHGGPVAAGDPADRQRPDAGAARSRSALHPGACAEYRSGQSELGRRRRRPTSSRCWVRSRTRLPELGDDAEVLSVVTPADWARQGMAAGTPFALAHTFGQTGPFRPANTVRGVDNVVLAGSSTVPGVGVPTAVMSGRLAADRITGVPRTTAESRGVPTMISSELDAAGVRDPSLREAYRRCREINARDGKTFFLATRLLAPRQRPAVHALYGFARRADDILDDFDTARDVELRAQQLQQLSTQLFNALVENRPCGDDPTLAAVVHTARKYDIGWDLFDDFLASMRMDLTVTDYPDRARAGPLHVRLGGSDRSAVAARFWAPSARGRTPRRTPPRSERRFSSPISSGMSTKTCNVAGCTCPPTNSPPTASTVTCWAGARPIGAPIRACVGPWSSNTRSRAGVYEQARRGHRDADRRRRARVSRRR